MSSRKLIIGLLISMCLISSCSSRTPIPAEVSEAIHIELPKQLSEKMMEEFVIEKILNDQDVPALPKGGQKEPDPDLYHVLVSAKQNSDVKLMFYFHRSREVSNDLNFYSLWKRSFKFDAMEDYKARLKLLHPQARLFNMDFSIGGEAAINEEGKYISYAYHKQHPIREFRPSLKLRVEINPEEKLEEYEKLLQALKQLAHEQYPIGIVTINYQSKENESISTVRVSLEELKQSQSGEDLLKFESQ